MLVPEVSNIIDRPVPTFLSVADARLQLNLFGDTSQDDYLQMMCSVAQEQVEDYIGQYLQTTTTQNYYRYFDESGLIISQPNISCVTVKYWNENDDLITIDPSIYFVDTTIHPVLVKPRKNQNFPATNGLSETRVNPIQITYESILFGADSNMDIERVRQAMMLILTHWYNDRSNNDKDFKPEIEYGFLRLLNKYRLPTL